MHNEKISNGLQERLADLRVTIGERYGFADIVDQVCDRAGQMEVGEILEFETESGILSVERTGDGFHTKIQTT